MRLSRYVYPDHIEPTPAKTDRIEFDDAVPGFGVRAAQGRVKGLCRPICDRQEDAPHVPRQGRVARRR